MMPFDGAAFIHPSVHAYLASGSQANQAFGTTEILVSGTIFAAGESIYNRPVLKFDLSSLPANAIIQQAILVTHIESNNLIADTNYTIKGLTRTDFVEATVTWNFPWTTPGGDFSGAASPVSVETSGSGFMDIDCTDIVKGLYATNPTIGLIVFGGEVAGASNYLACHSEEDPDPSLRPFLQIGYKLVVATLPFDVHVQPVLAFDLHFQNRLVMDLNF